MSRENELVAAEQMREAAANVCDDAAQYNDNRSEADKIGGIRATSRVRALRRAARVIRALPAELARG